MTAQRPAEKVARWPVSHTSLQQPLWYLIPPTDAIMGIIQGEGPRKWTKACLSDQPSFQQTLALGEKLEGEEASAADSQGVDRSSLTAGGRGVTVSFTSL